MAIEKLGPKAKSALEEVDKLSKSGGPRARSMAMRVAKKIREPAAPSEKLGDLRERVSKLEKENRTLRERVAKLEVDEAGAPEAEE